MLHSYTALDANNPRARAIRARSWDELPASIRVVVTAFLAGETRDPFPRATHWAGRADGVKAWEAAPPDGVIANRFVHETKPTREP